MEATFFSETSVVCQKTVIFIVSAQEDFVCRKIPDHYVYTVRSVELNIRTVINDLTAVFLTSHDSKPHGCVIVILSDGQWPVLPSSVAV
jgi:hypothetical protein